MTKRITYIDALKGLAIILVVCGHIAEKSMGIENSPFNRMYGSFHMPLFIFLSGLFAYKGMEQITGKRILNFLQKKAVRILLPFMIVGGFYSIIVTHDALAVFLGTSGGYWFLPALFYCMILGLAQRILVGCLKGGGNHGWCIIPALVGCCIGFMEIALPYSLFIASSKTLPVFHGRSLFLSV